MSFDTERLEELKNLIGRDQSSWVKFATKLFHVLTFSRFHPGSLFLLGASWCSDGMHFICNSGVMGVFVGLKANSIDTHFREHGFEIIRYSVPDLTTEFPCLPANGNWKKRLSRWHIFTAFTSLSDIERIPCGGMPFCEHQGTASAEIPRSILAFVRQSEAVERRVLDLWGQLGSSLGPALIGCAYPD